jgi:hypothetical protein
VLHPRLLALALALGLAPLPAQSLTSPRGLLGVEGDARHFALFNPGYQRFLQIDDSWTGQPVAGIRALAFRRDGEQANPFGGARSVDLEVRLGRADYAAASGSFVGDWTGTPTVAFRSKTIQIPDWSQLAATRPAPFDLLVPLDAAWSYDGTQALAFELTMRNTTGILGPEVDAERGTARGFTQAVGAAFDFGCLVSGQGLEMTHSLDIENHGPNHPTYGIRLGLALRLAPPGQAAVVNLDFSDPMLRVPGLCTTLHALPNIALPLGGTDPSGTIPRVWFDVPHAAALEGLHLFTQALVLDPRGFGLPIALSERRDAVIPDAPRPAPRCAYAYATSATATAATLWRDRGVVVRFDR